MRASWLPLAVSACFIGAMNLACLEPPGVGRAADPSRAPGQAPWGSATSNEELARKLRLLDDILDGAVKTADLPARVERDWPGLTPDDRARTLQSVTELVAGLTKQGKEGVALPPGPDRDMVRAQLFFSERRFIEAATLLSQILDKNPIYPGARNLLARCFFFLQNRDRTLAELEFVLTHPEQQKDRDEVLDALFLMGAAVVETPGMSRDNMEKGLRAWETYLKLAPDSPQKPSIEKGIEEIRAGLAGTGRLAQPIVATAAEADGADNGDVRGGARTRGPQVEGGGSPGPQAGRTASLPADAAPAARALAEGLDALDARDLVTAEQKLREVLAASAEPRASSEARVGLGRVFVQSGRLEDALKTFGEVIRADPDFMPAWHYLGMAHMMGNDPAQAVSAWQKIVDKDPDYARRFKLDQRIAVAKRMAQ